MEGTPLLQASGSDGWRVPTEWDSQFDLCGVYLRTIYRDGYFCTIYLPSTRDIGFPGEIVLRGMGYEGAFHLPKSRPITSRPPSGSATGGKGGKRCRLAESGWTNRAPFGQKGPSCFLPSVNSNSAGKTLCQGMLRGLNARLSHTEKFEICSCTGRKVERAFGAWTSDSELRSREIEVRQAISDCLCDGS